MPTGKIVLKTTEEYMDRYTPIYKPLFPLLMKNSQSYTEQVGNVKFNAISAIGDIRNKHITPKDTEIFQINAGPSQKEFKKYFLGSQFQISQFQDQEGTESVIDEVLEENNKYFDEIMVTGDVQAGVAQNNGLFTSSDVNYTLKSSVEVQKDSDDNYLIDLYKKVATTLEESRKVSGQKLVIFYGELLLPQTNGLFPVSNDPFFKLMRDGLEGDETIIKMPSDITPAGQNGWLIYNLDHNKLHYVTVPKLAKQGSNEEKDYNWFNFLMGSNMIEVKKKGALIRQPATLEA